MEETTTNFDNAVKLITPVIIILTFIVKEIITYKYFKKQLKQSRSDFNQNFNNSIELAKKNWYLNVLIQPNVKFINEFYENVVSDTIADLNELKESETTLSLQEYKSQSVTKQRNFKGKKRSIEFNFIQIVRSISSNVATTLTGKINELDDLISNHLMSQEISSVDIDEVERKINLNKVEMFSILFSYIENIDNKTK